MSKAKGPSSPQRCSWSYLCMFEPAPEEMKNQEKEEEKDLKEKEIVWMDSEFVEKVKSKCPDCCLLDRILFLLCAKGRYDIKSSAALRQFD